VDSPQFHLELLISASPLGGKGTTCSRLDRFIIYINGTGIQPRVTGLFQYIGTVYGQPVTVGLLVPGEHSSLRVRVRLNPLELPQVYPTTLAPGRTRTRALGSRMHTPGRTRTTGHACTCALGCPWLHSLHSLRSALGQSWARPIRV